MDVSQEIGDLEKARVASNKIKAEFYFNSNTQVFIKTITGWLHSGDIKQIATNYLLLEDFTQGTTILTYLEIAVIDKNRNQSYSKYKDPNPEVKYNDPITKAAR